MFEPVVSAPDWLRGPDASPIAQAVRFGRDPLGFLDDCRARYGDTFVLRLPGEPPIVVTAEPKRIRQLFALRAEAFRSERLNLPINMGPASLAFQDGEAHRRTRRAVQPTLHGEALRGYEPGVLAEIDAHLARLREGDVVTLHAALQEMTMDVFLGSLFGAFDPARRARLRGLLHTWLGDVMSPLTQVATFAVSGHQLRRLLDGGVALMHRAPRVSAALARAPMGRALVAKQRMEVLLREDVQRLRARPDPARADVLARLVETRHEDGAALSDEEIVDQLVTLLTGGHETTAATLAWTFDLLLRAPDALRRATDEARAAGDGILTAPLPWIDACVQEAMRIRPAGVATPRFLAQPLTFDDGRTVPAGCFVWASTYLVQQRADVFPEPGRFLPERFVAGSPPAGTFAPFGGGLRRCLGVSFAEREMTLVTARVLQTVALGLTDAAALATTRSVFRGVTLVPDHRVPVRVLARYPGAPAPSAAGG